MKNMLKKPKMKDMKMPKKPEKNGMKNSSKKPALKKNKVKRNNQSNYM